MKKILFSVLLAGSVSCALAGSLQWGSLSVDGNTQNTWYDQTPAPFTGYAYLFLLSGQNNTVSFDGTSWNLNGASQLAYSPAKAFYGTEYPEFSPDGMWGSFASPTADANINQTYYYQAILVTAPAGNTTLSGTVGLGGFWQATGAKLVANYGTTGGTDMTGLLAWQTPSTSWAPVAAVPEPATMALFGLGGLALVIRRKMRKEA